MTEEEILSAEIAEDWVEADKQRSTLGVLKSNVAIAGFLVVIFLSSTLLYFFLEDEPVEYGISMDYDQDRTRGYVDDLLELGHPEWKGRMSGSAEAVSYTHLTLPTIYSV